LPFKQKEDHLKISNKEVNEFLNDELIYEYVDMLIFLFNIGIWLNINFKELEEKILNKIEKNRKRYL